MDAPAVTSGLLPSEPAGSDNLGMEPGMRVDVEETLNDLNILVVCPVERISNLPNP